MSKKIETLNKPVRWIADVQNGVVRMVREVGVDAFVVSGDELPDLCANKDFISDDQARLIENAIKSR